MCLLMGQMRREGMKFWNGVNGCLRKFRGKKGSVVGHMNRRFGSSEVLELVGKWGVERVNGNGEH